MQRPNPPTRLPYSLIACLGAAFVLRLAAILFLRSYEAEGRGYEHGEIAASLARGEGFKVGWFGAAQPTSQQAPIYPFVLALCYKLAGTQTAQAHLVIQLLQCLLGVLLAFATWGWLRETLPERPGIAITAAWGTALYPTLVYSATHIQVAALAAALVPCALWTGARAQRSGATADLLLAGFVGGLLTLTDPILALVAAVIGLGLLVQPVRWQWRAVATFCFMAVLTISPWMLRNLVVHGEWVFIKSTFGYAFWQGNNPHSQGTDKLVGEASRHHLAEMGGDVATAEAALWRARAATTYIDHVALTADERAALGLVSEPERSRRLLDRARSFVAANPGRYAELCLARLGYFLWFDPTNPKASSPYYRIPHGILTALAALGLCATLRHPGPFWISWCCVVTITAFHTLTITAARFHIPLEPILIAWAAWGMAPVANFLLPRLQLSPATVESASLASG